MKKIDLITPFANCWQSLYATMRPSNLYLTLIIAMVLLGLAPLLLPGIPDGHDLGFHLSRLSALAEALKNGASPWINYKAVNGMGYGPGLFYSDIFLYPAALLVNAGISLINAYKIFLLLWALGTALSTYYVLLQISGRSEFAAFAGTALYVWSSYYAVDLITRAAMGEITAFLFAPWIILGVYRVLFDDPRRFMPLAAGFAGIFYAHSISFILFTIIVTLLLIFNFRRLLGDLRRVGYIVLAGIFCIGMSAFAIVPLFEQLYHLQFNLTGQTMASPLAERMVPLPRVFLEIPYMKLDYWIPPGIGIIFVIVFLQRLRFKSDGENREVFRDIAMICAVVCLLAATNFLPYEGMMRVLASIQFPWRFYLPATLFGAVAGGLILQKLTGKIFERERYWVFILICFCGFAWFFNVAYFYAARIYQHNIIHELTNEKLQDCAVSGLHYLPQGVKLPQLAGQEKILKFTGDLQAKYQIIPAKYGTYKFRLEAIRGRGKIQLPITPYYGYRALLLTDKSPAEPLPLDLKNKLVTVTLPDNVKSATVEVYFRTTKLQYCSLLLTIVTLLSTGGYVWMLNKQIKE